MQIINQLGGGFEKAAAKLTPEQLDRPVDEVVSPQEEKPVVPAESVPAEPIEDKPEAPAVAEPEEDKVPKSRFLTMHQRAIEAEKALRQFEAERVNSEPERPVADDADLKRFYTETFGDTPLSDKLYQAELARLTAMEERATNRAFERLSEREQEEAQTITSRVESMDMAFEELSVVTGKELSDDEQVAILDIVEKYSPKDKNGKIPEEYLLPLDQAYEIYQLQAEKTEKPNKQERNAVAALSGVRSQGAPDTSSDSNWKPGQRARWENKLPR